MTLTRDHSTLTSFKRSHDKLMFTAPSLDSAHPVEFTFSDSTTDSPDDRLTSSAHPDTIGLGKVNVYQRTGSLWANKGHHAPKDALVLVASYIELLRVQLLEAVKRGKRDKIFGKVEASVGKEIGKHLVNALMGGT